MRSRRALSNSLTERLAEPEGFSNVFKYTQYEEIHECR